jgi:hypothetical protein
MATTLNGICEKSKDMIGRIDPPSMASTKPTDIASLKEEIIIEYVYRRKTMLANLAWFTRL